MGVHVPLMNIYYTRKIRTKYISQDDMKLIYNSKMAMHELQYYYYS